jgi:hypothetical protein
MRNQKREGILTLSGDYFVFGTIFMAGNFVEFFSQKPYLSTLQRYLIKMY